jgi:hypothetical protein
MGNFSILNFIESDACEKNTSEGELARSPTYETINDPTIGHNIMNYRDNEQHDAISTVAHPQSVMITKLNKSNQKQEQPHLQQNSSSIIHHNNYLVPKVDTSRCLHAETLSYPYEENSQDEKMPACSDISLQVDQRGHYDQYERIAQYEKVPHCDLSLISSTQRKPCSDINQNEQNTNSCDLQVHQRGHYDQICQYERIAHYEKVPHCDFSLISSTQRKQAHGPPPSCCLTESGKQQQFSQRACTLV